MKAVIVEIRGKYVAALSDDGRVYKIKNNNYTIGQKIELNKQIFNNRYTKVIASIAASCAIFAVPAWAYYTPYYYVSVDINPSIEYSINRFDRVISANSVNGNEIYDLNLKDLKNKNIEVAVKQVIDEILQEGYIEDSSCDVVIATSSKNDKKSNELNLKLKSTVEEEIKKETSIEKVKVDAITVDNNEVEAAKELGVTPGKLKLVKELQETAVNLDNNEEINIEEWLEKPVKEIVQARNQYKKELKKEEKRIEKENKNEEKSNKNHEKPKANETRVSKNVETNKNLEKNNNLSQNNNSNNKVTGQDKKIEKEDKNDKNNINKNNSKEKENTKNYRENNNNNNQKNNNKKENTKERNSNPKKETKDSKKSNSNSVSQNKETKKQKEEENKVEINSIVCRVKSINKKDNSITVLRSNNKSFKVYLGNNTKLINIKGKDISISDLKKDYKLNISMEYKNNKFVASSIKVIDK